MANGLYDTGRNAFLLGDIDWVADDIRVLLIDTAEYTVNLATHQFLSSIPSAARVGTAVALAGKSASAGVADADDVSVTGLVAAPSIEACVIYRHTGTDTTSQLIVWIDSATGLPVAAGATQVDITWDNGANKIFKL